MGKTKPLVSADYVVGLTDGEGCFYVNFGRYRTYRSGVRVQLHFHIKMQSTDRNVLESIKQTLGCGNVYFQKEQRQNHAQCYRYSVSAHRDIVSKIIPFFLQHPLQTKSKSRSFRLFCRIADDVTAGKQRTARGAEQIRRLKKKMNQRTNGLA